MLPQLPVSGLHPFVEQAKRAGVHGTMFKLKWAMAAFFAAIGMGWILTPENSAIRVLIISATVLGAVLLVIIGEYKLESWRLAQLIRNRIVSFADDDGGFFVMSERAVLILNRDSLKLFSVSRVVAWDWNPDSSGFILRCIFWWEAHASDRDLGIKFPSNLTHAERTELKSFLENTLVNRRIEDRQARLMLQMAVRLLVFLIVIIFIVLAASRK